MKILFDDVFQTTGVVATSIYETVNYPPTKLFDRFLTERFQSDEADDTLTITLPAAANINCLFLGYTNSESYVIKLYSAADVLLATITIDNPEYISSVHFTEVAVKYLTVELSAESGSIAVYLGGIAGGISEIFPDPVAAWNEDSEDNSNYSNSAHGQSLQNYIKPLRKISYDFQNVSRTRVKEIKTLYEDKGIGGLVWVDAFENNDIFEEPLRGILTAAIVPGKSGRMYIFTLSLKEAR